MGGAPPRQLVTATARAAANTRVLASTRLQNYWLAAALDRVPPPVLLVSESPTPIQTNRDHRRDHYSAV